MQNHPAAGSAANQDAQLKFSRHAARMILSVREPAGFFQVPTCTCTCACTASCAAMPGMPCIAVAGSALADRQAIKAWGGAGDLVFSVFCGYLYSVRS